MRRSRSLIFPVALILILPACNQTKPAENAAVDSGKVPITTSSDEARKEYLQGRDLAERLLANDSLQHFDKAIALDPNFATAELARAANAATAKDFFDHLNKAVSLADKVSDGEKTLILAAQAGSTGDTAKQKEYFEKALAAFPNDERVQFAYGTFYFGQQEIPQAIEHMKKASEIAPNYSLTYNMLGYAYRQQGDYANAEQAFKKYIELIPNDPNPYDSYAELLLKMGRFSDSIEQYKKALSVDTHFVPSLFGTSADYMYMGNWADAQAALKAMEEKSRNDGELRTAYFGMAVVASDQGKLDQALKAMDKEYAVAEKKNDVVSMAADLQATAHILEAQMKYDAADKQFERSYHRVADSNAVSQDVKDNADLLHHFNLAEIAIDKKDLDGAKMHAEEFRKGAEAKKNPLQEKQAHELTGRIALATRDYGTAISELQQANLQDPRNYFRIGQAYQAKGEDAKSQEFYRQAADFNSLPQLNYAFIRTKAQRAAGEKKN